MGNLDGFAVAAWQDQFDQMIARIGDCFGRRDLRNRATKYIRGLLSPVQRKNSWQSTLAMQRPMVFNGFWDVPDGKQTPSGMNLYDTHRSIF
jgi:hypothetical protein